MTSRPEHESDDADLAISGRALRVAKPYGLLGLAAILVGGAVAAVSRPAGWDHGSWAAAYLVLVGGLGSWAGGAALAFLPRRGELATITKSSDRVFGLWVLSNAGVVAGNLLGVRPVLAAGSVGLLVVLLVAAVLVARVSDSSHWRTAFLVAVGVVVLSVPVGIVLALGD